MPKKGERARKLHALSARRSVRPPKRWFDMVKRSTKKQYPRYGDRRVGQIVGGIWAKASSATKKKIVKKYQR